MANALVKMFMIRITDPQKIFGVLRKFGEYVLKLYDMAPSVDYHLLFVLTF